MQKYRKKYRKGNFFFINDYIHLERCGGVFEKVQEKMRTSCVTRSSCVRACTLGHEPGN